MKYSIAVVGASGRMGQLICSLVSEQADLELHGMLNSQSQLSELIGADLVIDVTRPEVSNGVAEFAISNGLRLLIGTSGWTREKIETLRTKLKPESVVSIVPNFSIGSVLATEFVAKASGHFDSIEIIETHHPKKLDAPSGTALYTAAEIAKQRDGRAVSNAAATDKLFDGVPITSHRIEGAHAIQEVKLWGDQESLYVRHEVSSHQAYSAGILLAIRSTLTGTGLRVGLRELMADESS